jgi:cathepsin L
MAKGAPTEEAVPYQGKQSDCPEPPSRYRAIGYSAVPKDDRAEIKRQIAMHGALTVGVLADAKWQAYAGGVFSEPTDQNHGGHCVALVGWDDTKEAKGGAKGAWLIKNSWGTTWGEAGYMWLAYGTSSVESRYLLWVFPSWKAVTPEPPPPTPTPTPTPPAPRREESDEIGGSAPGADEQPAGDDTDQAPAPADKPKPKQDDDEIPGLARNPE